MSHKTNTEHKQTKLLNNFQSSTLFQGTVEIIAVLCKRFAVSV